MKISAATLSYPAKTDKIPIARVGDTVARYIKAESLTGGAYNVMNYGAIGNGVADDSDAIIACIAAVPVTGGVVYFPAGTYITSKAIEIYKKNNVVVHGDGMGLSTIDSSATANLTKVLFDPPSMGGVYSTGTFVFADDSGAALTNCVLRDLTVKTSTAASDYTHAVLCESTIGFVMERVEVIGGYNEIVYGRENFITSPGDWTIRNCEIHDGVNVAINYNHEDTFNYLITGNYIHDGQSGILMVGRNGVISNNRIDNMTTYGIRVNNEPAAVANQINVVVEGNVIYDVAEGIYAHAKTADGDVGLSIIGNVIGNVNQVTSLEGAGIKVYGTAYIANNVIGRAIADRDSSTYGIWVASDGGGKYTTIANNLITDVGDAAYGWSHAIAIASGAAAIVLNNIIGAYAVYTGGFAIYNNGTLVECDNNYIGSGKYFDGSLYGRIVRATEAAIYPDDADTTPTIKNAGIVFCTSILSPVTWTNLDDGYTGKQVTILFNDSDVTIDFTSAGFLGKATDWNPGVGDSMVATYNGSHWYCIGTW